MASAESFRLVVRGTQTHGAYPWMGADPILASAHIVTALQSIVSRNANLTEAAAVVTVGSIHGGNRSNIIPEEVRMEGTLRALTPESRLLLRQRLTEVATQVGASLGTRVQVEVPLGVSYPVTYNSLQLTERMLPSLQRAAGAERVQLDKPATGAEDFAFFAEKVPGLYFFLGGRSAAISAGQAPAHHTPDFQIDDSGLGLGVRALVQLSVDYLESTAEPQP
jgi:amidohydrolase